jgi:TatD DNase family protein
LSSFLKELPRLDCHAHVAPDVTDSQVQALGDAFVFAVTRSLAEAARVHTARYPQLIWGCGVHPRLPQAISAYDERQFGAMINRFPFVGEIGLDGSTGSLVKQVDVLESILRTIAGRPILCSLHSAGAADQLIALLAKHRPRGAVLHWFTGTGDLIDAAVELGCGFSVNVAMNDAQLLALPLDRILPETDFPAARTRRGARRPGDVTLLEGRLARLWGKPVETVRIQFFQNLRDLAVRSGALDRLPDALADALVAV